MNLYVAFAKPAYSRYSFGSCTTAVGLSAGISAPVVGSSETPDGSDPSVTDQAYGVVPPVACTVSEYGWPTVPPERLVVVMASGSATRIASDCVSSSEALSVTRTVKAAFPASVGVPVIASGGAGKLEHFLQGVTEGHADVLLAASVFHFRTFTVRQVKEYLKTNGIPVLGV